MGRSRFSTLLVAGLSSLLAGCVTTPSPVPEIVLSYDGLVPVEGTQMSRVWIREGFSLAGYNRVMLVSAGIQYRPRSPNEGTQSSSTQPTREERELFESLITEEFDTALDRLILKQASGPGPDVLLVRGVMLDVVTRNVVSRGSATSASQRLDSVGQATFMVELIDSESNAVLVRALDTRSAKTPGRNRTEQISDTEVRNLISRWANMLVDALNDLTTIDSLHGA
jgi:hypothetical protein